MATNARRYSADLAANVPAPTAVRDVFSRLSLPAASEPACARNERVVQGLLVAMGAGELATLAFAPLPGAVLFGCTGALAFFHHRGRRLESKVRADAVRASVEEQTESLGRDRLTGLPHRAHLLEQLRLDIARAVRGSQDVTLAIVQIAQYQELRAAWGATATDRAATHVASTLQRIGRASDFLARIDDERFAAILVQCNSEQAQHYADRVALAVANRPLPRDELLKVPVYVTVHVEALQFDPERFRGPLDFLSAAGGEDRPAPGGASPVRRAPAFDARELRRQLIAGSDAAGRGRSPDEGLRREQRARAG
jgi:diguanylate cyclase (GGDEF)-like protein